MVDFLRGFLHNKTINDLVFCGGKYADTPPSGFWDFDAFLPAKMSDIGQKGKTIWFCFENSKSEKFYMVQHIIAECKWTKKYSDSCKWFIEASKNTTIWFDEVRSYSELYFTRNKTAVDRILDTLGTDILDITFVLPVFRELVARFGRRNITSFLMDQALIAGCGNILKSEILWYANISPMRKIETLSDDEVELLYEGIIVVSRIFYNRDGFKLVEESPSFDKYNPQDLQIYGKETAKQTVTTDGRLTYWDPYKQT